MAHIVYSRLRGKIDRFKPAPSGNPHLWLLIDAGQESFFATINVQSSKDAPGSPTASSYLYFFVDDDFRHPILHPVRAADIGMQELGSTYEAGALDFVKGNLFDPRKMRVLPSQAAGGDDLVHRLEAIFGLARDQNQDVVIFGSQFATSRGQTDAVFGETPRLGIDNTHMAQGDPPEIDDRIHENGAWHDGGIFLLDTNSDRVTAVFLAFQTQAWQTDEKGQPLDGTTGYEAPRYTFSGEGVGEPIPALAASAELTSLNRQPDGTGVLIVTNMSSAAMDFTGWSVMSGPGASAALPGGPVASGQPATLTIPAALVADEGGILTLLNPDGLKVDGVSYPGGASAGWSSSFSD